MKAIMTLGNSEKANEMKKAAAQLISAKCENMS